jgi:hypothetical protein
VRIAPDSSFAIAVTPLLQEPIGQIQVLLLTSGFGKLHQCQFYFLVPRHPGTVLQAECRIDVIGHPHSHIQQFSFAGGVVVGDRGFHQMAGTVVLVLFHVSPPFVQAGKGVVSIEVTVG